MDAQYRKSLIVSQPRLTKSNAQPAIAKGPTIQMNGALKGRGRLGSRRRRTITPEETMKKAKRVPEFEMSASMLTGNKPANKATATPVTRVTTWGVWYRSCT